VPREGITPGSRGGGSYGDRRLRDVAFVDYSRPGFAVVYAAAAEAPTADVELVIRDTRLGPRVAPEFAAVGAAGRIVVTNASAAAHVLSFPAAGVVRPLGPGERAGFDVPRAGEQGVFLLDAPELGASVFAAPGPFAVVAATGQFVLNDLAPGARELRVWHPRFPPASQRVELVPDARVEIDFDLGVGQAGDEHAHH
jgi:hypothetical protein